MQILTYMLLDFVCKPCHFICKPFKELFQKPPTVLTNIGGNLTEIMKKKKKKYRCKDKHFLFKFFLFYTTLTKL